MSENLAEKMRAEVAKVPIWCHSIDLAMGW